MIFNSKHPFGILPYAPMSTTQSASTGNGSGCDQKLRPAERCHSRSRTLSSAWAEDFDAKPATMYFTTGRCETNKRVLQSSDETTMSALYVAQRRTRLLGRREQRHRKGCGGARNRARPDERFGFRAVSARLARVRGLFGRRRGLIPSFSGRFFARSPLRGGRGRTSCLRRERIAPECKAASEVRRERRRSNAAH